MLCSRSWSTVLSSYHPVLLYNATCDICVSHQNTSLQPQHNWIWHYAVAGGTWIHTVFRWINVPAWISPPPSLLLTLIVNNSGTNQSITMDHSGLTASVLWASCCEFHWNWPSLMAHYLPPRPACLFGEIRYIVISHILCMKSIMYCISHYSPQCRSGGSVHNSPTKLKVMFTEWNKRSKYPGKPMRC